MATIVEDPPAGPPPAKPPMSTGDKVRFALRGVGQTFITLGVVVLLFVVYEVWITNIFADRNNSHNISALRHEVDTINGAPALTNNTIPIGSALGILYIPRLGRDYAEAIVQGNTTPDDDQLEQGTAHYGGTQLPGQKGNFAVAGHRVGKGEPFLNIDQLRSGDKIIVESRDGYWYVYQVLGSPNGGDPQSDGKTTLYDTKQTHYPIHGRQIIDPSDGDVLDPIPNINGSQAPTQQNLNPNDPIAADAVMTMTTCHPKFTATHRMVIFSELVDKYPALPNSKNSKASDMPAQIKALYNEVSS